LTNKKKRTFTRTLIKETHGIPKVQCGAPGIHSDASEHVRCAEPDTLNPRSQVYVAVAFRVSFPSKPEVKDIDPFSGGKRGPQSV